MPPQSQTFFIDVFSIKNKTGTKQKKAVTGEATAKSKMEMARSKSLFFIIISHLRLLRSLARQKTRNDGLSVAIFLIQSQSETKLCGVLLW